MQPLHLVHFENATPAMADLGLEHLLGPLFQAIFQKDINALQGALTTEGLGQIMKGLAEGSKRQALRRLTVALVTPGAELLKAEGDPKAMKALEDAQALRPIGEIFAEFMDFFSSLGLSLPDTPDSSGETEPGSPVISDGPSGEAAGS